MSYADLLRDPRWQRKRLEVMEAADFSCAECGDRTTTLNVHHTYYKKGRKPWEYEADALRCLCEDCHKTLSRDIADVQRGLSLLSYHGRDQVIGFMRATLVCDFWMDYSQCDDSTPSLTLESDGMIEGAARGLMLDYDEVFDALVDDVLTWHAFRNIYRARSDMPLLAASE